MVERNYVTTQTVGELTEQRNDDDDEVEDVPRLLEVVQPQSEQLDDALEREDGQERDVDDLQRVLVRFRHSVELDSHRQHVEHDEDHDENVELLVARQIVEQQLQPELRNNNNKNNNDLYCHYYNQIMKY